MLKYASGHFQNSSSSEQLSEKKLLFLYSSAIYKFKLLQHGLHLILFYCKCTVHILQWLWGSPANYYFNTYVYNF